ncbi:MAG TPA: hypothetical protein VIU46_08100 [Gallionellaceae bacterium]
MQLGESYTVRASSELKSANNAYAAKKVIPPSLGTAWCEGAAGDGVGEWLEFTLKSPMLSDGGFKLGILPGFAVSPALYRKNNRPKKLAVILNNDSAAQEITLEDYAKYQSFPFEWQDKPVTKIRLKILEVYKGEQYADTCITDVAIQQKFPKHYLHREREDLPDPKLYWQDWSERESAMLNHIYPEKIDRDSLSFIMGLSEGMYIRGAEGGEALDEKYLESLMHNPTLFMQVLDKQNEAALKRVSESIISPIFDKYSPAQIREAVTKGMQPLEPAARERLKPLLDALPADPPPAEDTAQ